MLNCEESAENHQELLFKAEIWIAKVGTLTHPCGFNDGGILITVCKALLYYAASNKDNESNWIIW